MRLPRALQQYRRPFLAIGVLLLLLAGPLHIFTAQGAQLPDRFVKLSSGLAGATGNYLFGFTVNTPGSLGSIVMEICADSPFPGTSCVAPNGFDATNAVLANQTGETGFTISPLSTANRLVLTRVASAAGAVPVTYEFTTITNPSSPGSYFGRLQTFASTDGSGAVTDQGGLAFALNNALGVTAEVPPYLIFCTGIIISTFNCQSASGDTIDFGELSSHFTSNGTSQMLAATNAKDGYNLTMNGTTMTSGNNVISAIASDVSRPGTSQFGLNLRSNNTPLTGTDPAGPGVATAQPTYNQPDFYNFTDSDTLVTTSVPDDVSRFTVSYIVNVTAAQPPGIYVSTLTYICLGSF